MPCNCDELKALQVINNQKLDDLLALLQTISERVSALENATYDIDVTNAIRTAISPLLEGLNSA